MNERSVATAQKNATAQPTPLTSGLLQRKCACGNHTVAGGECAECAKKKTGLQRKLAIGASNDPLELEADRIADQVMAAPTHHAVSATPPRIQRYAGQASEGVETAPASVDRVLSSSGRPLELALRQDMEQRFGHDFSRVRVHSGVDAEQSARDVNALAYTVGHNIVFGSGRFASGSHQGRRLIAHELAHVVQQSSANERNADNNSGEHGPLPIDTRAEAAAPNVLQRLGDLTKVPTGLGCPVAASSPASPVTNVFMFSQNSFALNAVQIAELENFVRAWHEGGASDHIRIDGFASTEGTDELNWTLSCQRAEAVLAELASPSSRTTPGIPAGFIEELAQGETDEFGTTLPPNRRAQITTSLVVPPESFAAAPACPGGSASTRMTATIKPVRVARDDGSNPTVLPSFARLDIWRRCCVDFRVAAPATINSTAMQIVDDTGGLPTAEEQALTAAAPGGTQINVIIVKNFDTGGGVLNPNSGGGALTNPGTGAAHETVIAVEGTVSEVIAHEVGHAIGASHTCPNTIMCGTGAHDVPNPEHVNAAICTVARTGAVLAASATACCTNPT